MKSRKRKKNKFAKYLIIADEGLFVTRPTITAIHEDRIVVDNTKGIKARMIYGTIFLGVVIFFFYGLFFIPLDDLLLVNIIYIFFMSFSFILSCLFLVTYIKGIDRKYVFNRAEGTVTMPGSLFNYKAKPVTIPFADIRMGTAGSPGRNVVIFLPGSSFWYIYFWPCEIGASWISIMSFFIWYMDRNRPLPKGHEFAPYRLADFQRRKSEGFPPPLYKSVFSMTDVDGSTSRYPQDLTIDEYFDLIKGRNPSK